MKDILINAYSFNLRYAHALVRDVSNTQMTTTPAAGFENHPAFTLGHLVSGAALTSKYLGGPYEFHPEWEHLFKRKGPGDPRYPDLNISLYPGKSELLNELDKQHQLVEQLIIGLEPQKLTEPTKWRFHQYMPNLGDLLYFMCITHESMHLGQLAGWRRAMSLPSALASL